jgi:agmatinase
MTKTGKQTTFHGDDVLPTSPEEALFHVLPVPYENSVSYGTGTAAGPNAIIEASAQLELLACNNNPSNQGICTLPSIDCAAECNVVLERIARQVKKTVNMRSIPVILGGEHTVTCGVVPTLKELYGDIGVIQFDAHADLRDQYEGSIHSHACVMRRIHEQGIPIFQIGTRSYSIEEQAYRQRHMIPFLDSEDVCRQEVKLELPQDFPEKVYLTFDVDGLDSAIMPATGTPVPGGLNWYQAMWYIESIMQSRICIGFDVVEFAPIENLHACTFTTAQLVYNLMGYLTASEKNLEHWGY